MKKKTTPVKIIKSPVGCDVDEKNFTQAITTQIVDGDVYKDKVQNYQRHAQGTGGLKPKYASNFRIDLVDHLMKIPTAAFLRVYIALNTVDAPYPILIMAVTDIKGKVLDKVSIDATEAIAVVEECCGNPPGDEKFDHDPFLLQLV